MDRFKKAAPPGISALPSRIEPDVWEVAATVRENRHAGRDSKTRTG
jgi:hypothetical protein